MTFFEFCLILLVVYSCHGYILFTDLEQENVRQFQEEQDASGKWYFVFILVGVITLPFICYVF